MKVFTLEKAEEYFSILTKIKKKLKALKQSENPRGYLVNAYSMHIRAIENDIDKKFRIIYLIRFFSALHPTYNLKDFQVIGNYDDVILRLELKT